jgi:RND family efflux transporter MFP subunit
MKKSLTILTGLLTAVWLASLGGRALCQEKPKREGQGLPLVRVAKAQKEPLAKILELTGTVTPTRQARLASPSEGPVQNCRVREGDQVKRGQRLLTIGRAAAAAAQVTAAAEAVKEQEAELNRIKILVQSGAVPGSQLDTAKARYEGARALLAKAREMAGDYAVEAPWDGVVSKVLVKDGDFVAPRAPLVEMYDPGSLVIRLAVPEAQATEVFRGTPATVQLDAYPGKTFEGKVSLVYPDLDTRMRTRTAEVKLETPVALLPGMFARLRLTLSHETEGVVIPIDAVLVGPGGEKVVFVVKDGKAQRRVVQTGVEAKGRVQVLAGLGAGETVVTAGHEKLKEGTEVKVQEEERQ